MEKESSISILLNFGTERIFGCSRRCDYCNWKSSKNIGNIIPTKKDIQSFLRNNPHEYVTLSGGGDPLWKYEKNKEKLLNIVNTISEEKKSIRFITREVKNFLLLVTENNLPSVKAVSFSLDGRSFEEWKSLTEEQREMLKKDFSCEFSMVLPAFGIENKSYYLDVFRKLGGPYLTLRENLNDALREDQHKFPSFKNETGSHIRYIPTESCLNSLYMFSGRYEIKTKRGYEILGIYKKIYKYLNEEDKDIYIYGSYVKHLLLPNKFLDFGDIDIMISSSESAKFVKRLEEEFGFEILYSDRKNIEECNEKGGHIVLQHSEYRNINIDLYSVTKDPSRYILKSQFSSERVFFHQGKFVKDEEFFNIEDIEKRLYTKIPFEKGDDICLFTDKRNNAEAIFENKLKSRGWKIKL